MCRASARWLLALLKVTTVYKRDIKGVLLVTLLGCSGLSTFALPRMVRHTASLLEDGQITPWLFLWVGMLVIAVGISEFLFQGLVKEADDILQGAYSTEDTKSNRTAARRRTWQQSVGIVQGVVIALLQAVTVLQYFLLLDGHRHFRACYYAYLGYAVPALVILVVRWKSWSRLELIYMRWGWVPVIPLGIPLFLPIVPPLIPRL